MQINNVDYDLASALVVEAPAAFNGGATLTDLLFIDSLEALELPCLPCIQKELPIYLAGVATPLSVEAVIIPNDI